MASQALYRKWRPQVWDDVVSQEHVIRVLKNAIRSDRVGHAYLFSGPRGTGKTTVARILARAVNCLDEDPAMRPCDHCANCEAVAKGQFFDLIEIDAASNTSVEDVRELRDKINFAPAQGRMKVYIIDEVHMLSTAAFNALLKTLEEPPSHAMFILATTEIHKIPATVLSRCQHHEFRRIPVIETVKQLEKICAQENIEYEIDALSLIARQSTGAMRDAISMLDQLGSTGDKITLAAAQNVLGVAANQAVSELIDAIAVHDTAEGLNVLHDALDAGSDARQLARQTVEYLRLLLIMRMGSDETLEITDETRAMMMKQSQKLATEQIVEMIRLFNQAASEGRSGWHPGLSLELALAESCAEKKEVERVVQIVEKRIVEKVSAALDQNEEEDNTDEALAQMPNRIFIKKGLTPDPSATREEIEAHWKEIRALIKEYDAVMDAALNHANLLEVKEGVLCLGFPRETIKNKVEENKKFLTWTSAAISKVLGKSVGVSCMILNKKKSSAAVDPGSLVDTALQLGGKLVVDKGA